MLAGSMNATISDAQLLAFLEEALPPTEAAAIENRLRADPELLQRLGELRAKEDAGVHSLGAIWRRYRLSCPTREQLGQWLLGYLMKKLRIILRSISTASVVVIVKPIWMT